MVFAVRANREGSDKLFPPRSGPKRRRARSDSTQEQIAFRVPPDLMAYIRKIEGLGYSKTDAILRLVEVARDAVDELDAAWWDIERAAHTAGITAGRALARYALTGIKAERRK